jgi:hypothetical protein
MSRNGRRTNLPEPWRRVDDSPRKTSATYRHPSGYVIEHCGHPTALWPYALYGPGGELIVAPNGMAWQKSIIAAIAVGHLLAGEAKVIRRGQLYQYEERGAAPDVSRRIFSRRHP